MKPKFGVGLYDFNEDKVQEVTREEMLALRVFELVSFNPRAPGRFHIRLDDEKKVKTFLKQWRAGR